MRPRPNVAAPPSPLPGFESIHRYRDPGRNCWVAKIQPGEYYVTTHPELIGTVLGSCVAACIRDPAFGIGGMNHFMLPAGGDREVCARYGVHAMELLINTILSHGGRRNHLEIKLFGGGAVMRQMTDVGQRNIQFARDFVAAEGFQVEASDLGGPWPRKILYDPLKGKVLLKRLKRIHKDTLAKKEEHYLEQLNHTPSECDVELFG